MRRRREAGLVLLGLVMAGPAAGQAAPMRGQRCDQTNAEADFRRVRDARGEETIFISGPARFVCTGGTVVEADSAVWRRSSGALELIGNVFYRDSAQALTANWANYLGAESALYARGSVVLRDRANGSEVRGGELEYLQASETRAVSRAIVRGRRPHAVLRASRDTLAAAPDTAPPIEVDAEWMEFEGDTRFRARGRVVIVRGTTNAYADRAEFDREGERLILLGSARVVDPDYRLRGDRIDALLTGNALRRVWAQGDTDLDADQLVVRAPRLVVGFEAGEVETLSAWVPLAGDTIGDPVLADTATGPAIAAAPDAPTPLEGVARAARDPAGEGETARSDTVPGAGEGPVPGRMEGVRAVAVAEGFRLEADSIHALAPGQRLHRVTAVGAAYGERTRDTLAVTLPDIIGRDWVEGDTIIGFFTDRDEPVVRQAPSAPGEARPDSVQRGGQELEQVVVVGEPARSLYRMRPEGPDAPELPGVNYMTASRIILHLAAGDVSRVEADGPIEGIYLDPQRARTAPADTAPPGDTIPPAGTVAPRGGREELGTVLSRSTFASPDRVTAHGRRRRERMAT